MKFNKILHKIILFCSVENSFNLFSYYAAGSIFILSQFSTYVHSSFLKMIFFFLSFHVFVRLFACLLQRKKRCLFRSFSHFLIGLFVFLVVTCMSCLYILEINPLSVVSLAIIFSHSEGCLFTLFIVSLLCKTF